MDLHSQDEAVKLLGRNGEIRKRIQTELPVRIVDRGNKVMVLGDPPYASRARNVLNELLTAVRSGYTPTPDDVAFTLRDGEDEPERTDGAQMSRLRPDLRIKPKTRGQHEYIEAMQSHEVTIAIGPAGTGKTFLAMAMAVAALRAREVNRMVLTRPAVEAGENLGFLPGDLLEKVNPYLRPLYDALYDLVEADAVRKYFDRDQIEVAPLAFMRGRTLNRSFAILDEAQNTTSAQMKMFLTRLGEGSRAVVTGDITQIDLPPGTVSGLIEARRILHDTQGVAVIDLTRKDVVRQPIVQYIVDAYDQVENGRNRNDTGTVGEPGEAATPSA